MLFHSALFGVFFGVVFVGFWTLRRWRLPRVLFLLTASYLFYMGWSPKYALLIAFSTTVDYFTGLFLERVERPRYRKLLLLTSVSVNLGVLAWFKYYNFFADSTAAAFSWFGLTPPLPILNVLLPAGISFYTFQSLSYTIDVYHRRLPATRNPLEFALFVAYFPQLVAGPIVRATTFMPQLLRTPEYDAERVRSGLLLMFTGLVKKVIIADVLADTLVDAAFARPDVASGWHLLLAAYGYAFQVYGDFSGYTDIARGASRMLGYELPLNFDAPYQAPSVRDFWRRWHLTLSTWLRDYLYIPLGGSRHGRWLTCRNMMITMLLCGLWHGAAWNFILFGLYHAVIMSASYLLRTRHGAAPETEPPPSWPRHLFQVVVTFNILCAGLIIFRSQTLTDMATIFERLLAWAPALDKEVFPKERGLWILLLAMVLHYLPARWPAAVGQWLLQRSPVTQGALAATGLGVLGVFCSVSHPFVYFQF